MSVSLTCVGLLGLLLFGLGFLVSATRGQTGRTIGYSDDPTDRLHKAVRAHANTAEYAPILAVLFFVLGARNPAGWVLVCIVFTTLARYLFAAGMLMSSSLAQPNPLRFVGAVGTYIGGIALSVALLVDVLAGP